MIFWNRDKPSVKFCFMSPLQDASLLFVVAGTLKLLQQVVGKEQKEVIILHQLRLDPPLLQYSFCFYIVGILIGVNEF